MKRVLRLEVVQVLFISAWANVTIFGVANGKQCV